MYYPPMGGPLKCKLKEGGGWIIRSFYKCDVVSAHSNAFQTHGMQSEYVTLTLSQPSFITSIRLM